VSGWDMLNLALGAVAIVMVVSAALLIMWWFRNW
jgi:hypothetical protein